MIENQLLKALKNKKLYYDCLHKLGQQKKGVTSNNLYEILNYEATLEVQKKISEYYLKYASMLNVDLDIEEYKKIRHDEQVQLITLLKNISSKLTKLTSVNGESLSAFDDEKKYNSSTEYYNNMCNIRNILIQNINITEITDLKKNINERFNNYKNMNTQLNRKLTIQSSNRDLKQYFDILVSEYNYQSLIEENNRLIEELEQQPHEHFYLAVKHVKQNELVIRCAICNQEKTISYGDDTVYYRTKTGGLLKKKSQRLEVLEYLSKFKENQNVQEEIEITKVKLLKKNSKKRKS